MPAIKRMSDLEVTAIYVRKPSKYIEKGNVNGCQFKSTEELIDDAVNWVYISTPISTHYELTKKYLSQGKNVICEKPLTDSHDKTLRLFRLAEKQRVQLYEVCMYQFHKQYVHLKRTVGENLRRLKYVTTKFSVPHLHKNDIRYQKELGGGGLLDVGYYPISLITSLFGEPKDIKSINYSGHGLDVDLFGSAIFVYENFYCIAEWGIGLPYANEVVITTEKQIIKYDRIFSKPETFETEVQVKEGLDDYKIIIGKDDQFVNMFDKMIVSKELDLHKKFNVEEIISAMEKI